MRRRSRSAGAIGLLAVALLATPALAVDGVVEINEARALAGGVAPGDAPGYPVTLSRAGSYRLTSNLATASKNTTAILVTADDVSVDLNGFTIACTFAAAGGAFPSECLPASGTGDGVAVDVTTRARTTVRGGVIRDMGRDGVRVGAQSRVERMHIAGNGEDGISIADHGSVADTTAVGNGARGIFAGAACSVSRAVVQGSGDDGISALFGSSVRWSAARGNAGRGVVVGPSSTLAGNTSVGNTGHGLEAGDDGVITGNTALSNQGDGVHAGLSSVVERNTVRQSGGDGIEASWGSSLVGNTAHGNVGYGLNLPSLGFPGGFAYASGYRDNVLLENGFSDAVLGGRQLGTNICGVFLCP